MLFNMLMYGFLLVAGKSAAKRLNKYKSYFFKNLDFLEGWSLENRQQKTLKKVFVFFKKLIFFGRLVAGKSATEKTEKYMFYFI